MANPTLTIIPKVAKVSKKIIAILGCNPGAMTLRGTNTYIIGSGKRFVFFLTHRNVKILIVSLVIDEFYLTLGMDNNQNIF